MKMGTNGAHVPAWKRLGLKLKYAKDEAPIPQRSELVENLIETNGHKRRKLSTPPAPGNEAFSEKLEPSEPPSTSAPTKEAKGKQASKKTEAESRKPQSTPESSDKSHRKSVSFTPDTKTEDGQSSKDLYNSWTQDGNITDDAGPLPDALKVVDAESASKVAKKPKKPKKSKSTLITNGAAGTGTDKASQPPTIHSSTTSPLTQYLALYHQDRVNWKFNKARQNQIFKHIFDLDKLPPSVDEALIAYVEGLESEPVRARLREQALKIRQEDAKGGLGGEGDDMSINYGIDSTTANVDGSRNQKDQVSTDEQRQKAAYIYAYRRHRQVNKHLRLEEEEEKHQLSSEWCARLAKRLRAERMLEKLGESVVPVKTEVRKREGIDYHIERNVPVETRAANGTTEVKRKRKRKRRTTMPDDDSSSDESSSDDSDAEDERIAKRLKAATENTYEDAKEAEKAKEAGREAQAKIESEAKKSEQELQNRQPQPETLEQRIAKIKKLTGYKTKYIKDNIKDLEKSYLKAVQHVKEGKSKKKNKALQESSSEDDSDTDSETEGHRGDNDVRGGDQKSDTSSSEGEDEDTEDSGSAGNDEHSESDDSEESTQSD